MTDTVGGPEPDPEFDAEFAKLLRDMAAGRPARVHEPSARARMLQSQWRDQPPPTTPWRGDAPTFGDATVEANGARKAKYRRGNPGGRAWPRNTAIAVIIGALAFAMIETDRGRSGAAGANAQQATSTVTATSDSAYLAADGMIPLAQLFPKTVPAADGASYELLQSGRLADCIKSDLVGARLAGLLAQSNGCVGGEEALYKDAAGDQFNVVVFTLEDTRDALRIMNDLSMNETDFEVATQIPPVDSGLADLSAEDAVVQDFASDGHQLGVFMAQWADGRGTDAEDLGKLLNPLQTSIGENLSAEGEDNP
ncbi:hypothetical protein [Actinospica robiniae]|uniref:SCO2583/SCO2584 N-terminal domain-containing protein n=1 Tax=Actinospica robiniae TaxID=304901 RepID=UPI00040D6065|nr:hypothetical protein [Actinospica robiniae]